MTPNPHPESSNMFPHRMQRYPLPKCYRLIQTFSRETLEDNLGSEVAIRQNEGEAAEYGIFFDDTEYDYMQHLRPVGEAADAVLLEAPSKDKGKGKAKEIVFGEKVPHLPGEVDGSWVFQRKFLLVRRRVNIVLKLCRMYLIVFVDFNLIWILIYGRFWKLWRMIYRNRPRRI